MNIGLKILLIVGIVILVIIILIVLLFVIPFRYLISLSYGDNEISFDFKYSIVTFNAFIALKSKVKYYLKILGITIFDSDDKKKDAGKGKSDDKKKNKKVKADINETLTTTKRLTDTDFMRDKSIDEEVRASNEDAKELLKSAKKFEKKQLEEIIKSGEIGNKGLKTKVDSFIDGLQNIIPPDMKYVLKKVSDEVFKLLKKLSPSDVDVDISYGSSDPYMLGIGFAVLAPIISLTGGDINAKPKFGSDEIEAKIELARRVPLIAIVMPVVRLLLDKKFRNIVFSKK